MKKQYNIGIYMRLSIADHDDFESESITNQRNIIKQFIYENLEFDSYKEYVDDGYTGTNFDRPAFKRLIEDVNSGKINLVITKSLSRFGRNYIECGNFIEKIFLDKQVRYIAIIDRVDTAKDLSSNDFMPIKAILNELYSRETSKNVRTSLRKKMYEGYYYSAFPLYGYKRHPTEKGRILINEETAPVVRKIFEMVSKGKTRREIANYLNDKKIKTPSQYNNMKYQKNSWDVRMVGVIVENENYTGMRRFGKYIKLSYKSKKSLFIPKKEREYVLNAHEAIISKELFDKCHNNNRYGKGKGTIDTSMLKLKTFLYCGRCLSRLRYHPNRKNYNFSCSKHMMSNEICDMNRTVCYTKIEKIVFDTINEIINFEDECNNLDKKKIANQILYDKKYRLKERLAKKNKELTSFNKEINNLYEKRLALSISESDYIDGYKKIKANKMNVENEIEIIKTQIEDLSKSKQYHKQIKQLIKLTKEKGIQSFTIEELSMLIDKIYLNMNEIRISFKIKFDFGNEKIKEIYK